MELKFKESDLNLFERFQAHCKHKGKTPEVVILDLIWDELNGSINSLKNLEKRVKTLEVVVQSLQKTPETKTTFAEWLDAELKRLKTVGITARKLCEEIDMKESTFHGLKNRGHFSLKQQKEIKMALKKLEKP